MQTDDTTATSLDESLPPLTRAKFLAAGGVAVGALAVPKVFRTAAAQAAPALRSDLFTLGVASGDPLPRGVVLWTRLAPEPLAGGGMPNRPVPVRWEMIKEGTRRIARRGVALAQPSLAHSVHVEVDGLEPDSWYTYRFKVGNQESQLGRTRTLPRRGDVVDRLRFAFASCQDYQNGYYTAFRHLAQEDVDLVIHLGDYIYEYGPEAKTRPGSPPPRVHEGPEVSGLESYRNRYARYKTDPELQAAHAAAPWFVTWDDHEVENNYADEIREENASPPGGDFLARRAAGYRAYYEHQPLRRRSLPRGPNLQLYRRFRFGDLAEFSILDTRQHRSDQPCGDGLKNCEGRFDEEATMTGGEQEQWLVDGLASSSSLWNVIAQQTIFAEVDFNPQPGSEGPAGVFNVDQWDGYVAQRELLTEFLASEEAPPNPVILTGDIHSSWVNDIKVDYDDPESQTVATEFVGTSITSDFPAPFIAPVRAALSDNPHIKFFDGLYRGYVRCDLDADVWRTDFRAVTTIDSPQSSVFTLRSFAVENGEPGAKPA